MNSQILKIKYLQCTRGHYHEGEQLNTVCLNSECKVNALCCCACVDEMHKGHTTTTLKKLLLDAAKVVEKHGNKEQVKPKSELFNTDIILNLIEGSKKHTLEAFHRLKADINQILGNMETNIQKYYDKVQQKIINPSEEKHASAQVLQCIETVQTSPNYNVASKALHQLLISLESMQGKDNNINPMSQQQLCQDSMLNLIQHSNQKVHHSSIKTLQNLLQSLYQSHESIEQSVNNVNNMFNHQIFYFSSQLKSPTIWLNSSNEIVCKKDKQYQVALMEPHITSEVTVFKYRLKPNVSKWIAFGVCYKKIIQKKGYTFDYKHLGHGCYMISSNGGVWSNSREDLNNVVKAFSFKQGDTITCVVNQSQKQIFFNKENSALSSSNNKSKEMYDIPYCEVANDQLHPCVVFFFEKDAVEYIPVIGVNEVPKYEYVFEQRDCHPKIRVVNNHTVRSLEGNEYRAAICHKSVQLNLSPKKISFKITKTTNNWLALGLCHYTTATQTHRTFDYKSQSHGYYMISSNGGSWSSIDQKKNNIVRSFKFGVGDVVDCEVVMAKEGEESDRLVFRKGGEVYEVELNRVKGDQLRPCVVMYYGGDEVEVLPEV